MPNEALEDDIGAEGYRVALVGSVRPAMSDGDYEAGQLTEGWRWVLAVGWALCVPGLFALGDAANSFGKPTWWLDNSATASWYSALAFILPLLVTCAAAANWRFWPAAAALGVVSLGIYAAVDASRSPAVAIGEAVLAAAAALVSLACLAGRVRHAPLPEHPDTTVTTTPAG